MACHARPLGNIALVISGTTSKDSEGNRDPFNIVKLVFLIQLIEEAIHLIHREDDALLSNELLLLNSHEEFIQLKARSNEPLSSLSGCVPALFERLL